MPIAMSMKKVEKPVTRMARSFWGRRLGHRKRSVFLGDRKWVRATKREITEPIAVASPAPKIPISSAKTKK